MYISKKDKKQEQLYRIADIITREGKIESINERVKSTT